MSRSASALLLALVLAVAATRGFAEGSRRHFPTLDEIVSTATLIAVISIDAKQEASLELDGRRVACGSVYHATVRDSLKGDGGELSFSGADESAFFGLGDYLVLLVRRDPAEVERELDEVIVPSGKLDAAAIDQLRCGIRAAEYVAHGFPRGMIAFDARAAAIHSGRWLRPEGPSVASLVRRRETVERGGESYDVVAWDELRALLVDALRASQD